MSNTLTLNDATVRPLTGHEALAWATKGVQAVTVEDRTYFVSPLKYAKTLDEALEDVAKGDLLVALGFQTTKQFVEEMIEAYGRDELQAKFEREVPQDQVGEVAVFRTDEDGDIYPEPILKVENTLDVNKGVEALIDALNLQRQTA